MNERAICKSLLVTISLLTGLAVSGNALADRPWYSSFKTKIYKIFVHKKRHHYGRDGALQEQINAVAEQVGAVETKVEEVENQFGAMGDQVGAIGGKVDAVEAQVGALGDRVGGVETQIGALQAQVKANGEAINDKQDPLDVVCPVGEAVVMISSDGSAMCDSVGSGGSPPPGSTAQVYSIPPEAFDNLTGGSMMNSPRTGGAYIPSGGSGTLVAPVNLPHGATITDVVAWIYDNTNAASANLIVTLGRRELGMVGDREELTRLESGVASDSVAALSNGDLMIEVDNRGSSYHVQAFSNWTGTNVVRLYGVQIFYEQ